MCGIVGYVGPQDARDVVLEGLRRLEYRGYDSAGIAVVADGELTSAKKAGKLANLEKVLAERPLPAATVGIGHTRWATHGGPTDRNAHPHLSADGSVAVIHNGIIENFGVLRSRARGGRHRVRRSETDTEVAAHLLAATYAATPEGEGRLAEAMRAVSRRLEGAFTLVATSVTEPDTLVAVAAQQPAGRRRRRRRVLPRLRRRRVHRPHPQRARARPGPGRRDRPDPRGDRHRLPGRPVEPTAYTVDWDAAAAEKGGYDWFMLKEIAEQPQAIADTLLGRLGEHGDLILDEVRLSDQELRDIDKIFVVSCGTSYHAGLIAKYAIEHWTRIPVEVEVASEFRYRDPVLDRSTLVIVISQSGETMDTLMALRHAKEQRARVLAICNANGSTIPRESDAVLYTHAGPEIAVASTKAFLSQIVACYLVGLFLAQIRGMKYEDEVAAIVDDLRRLPEAVAEVLTGMDDVRALGRSLADANTILFLGRHVGFPVALEGALKLKELAYIHAEGFAAGELKHGPIAVVDQGTPVIVIVPSPRSRESVHGKVVSNIQEVRARGARTIVIAEEGDDDVVPFADHIIRVPRTPTLLAPVVTTVPLQVLACEIADTRGYDVDQPRNLAKSVTVE